jgi:glycosyltransferase involved in cell wall biosynthesis
MPREESAPAVVTTRSPVRVTHVVFDLDGGGLETLVGEMARRWADSRVVMSIITLSGRVGRVGAAVRDRVEQFRVLRPLPLLSLAFPLGLARALRATRPDVVHGHSGAWFKTALAARLAGVPRVVYTEHGREHYDPPLLRALDRRAAQWTDVVVPVSQRLASYLGTTLAIPPQRLQHIANGVDTERYHPGPRDAAALDRLRLPPEALIVGSLGRLERVKRFDRLVETLARLPSELDGRPVCLVIFGEGGEREGLEALAGRLNVADRVRFPGWTADPPAAHRLVDVFALASESEGMSVSLLEAMASGTAPVAMDVGTNAELLGPTLAEQVVGAGDLNGFAAAVARALSDPGWRARLGEAARARVVERYSLAGMLASYEAVYLAGR